MDEGRKPMGDLAGQTQMMCSISRALWKRRVAFLLGALATVAAFAMVALLSWNGLKSAPEAPAIDLDGVDVDVVEAIVRARSLVEQSPRSADAWGQLAMILHAHEFHSAAAECYSTATRLDRRDAAWPYLQGLLLQSGPNPESAIPYFELAASREPTHALANLRLADALLECNRLDEASNLYLQALSSDPENTHALFGLGQLKLANRQYGEALRILEAISNDPHVRHRSSALRVTLHERLADPVAASRERQRLKTLPKDAPWPDKALLQVHSLRFGLQGLLNQAMEQQRQQRVDEMLDTLRLAVTGYPNSDEAWSHLAFCFSLRGDVEGAKDALRRCQELAPDSLEYRVKMARLQMDQGELGEATSSLREAIELNPHDGTVHYLLGKCLEERGQISEAVDEYGAALRWDPTLAEAQQRLDVLRLSRP